MRKNKMMRTGAIMVVLALMTSCFVGGTFAKYTTSGNGTDSARVAKFGVTVTAGSGAFSKTYVFDDKTAVGIGTDSVISTEKVVAPGTSGKMTAASVSGQPEVAVEVSYVAQMNLRGWTLADDTFYCPLVIKVGETDINGTEFESAEEFQSAVETAIADYTDKYVAGTDLSKADPPEITWEWPFTISDENDKKDTYLGDQAADNNASTVEIKMTTTVTQID